MSQSDKAAYYQALKAHGVEFTKHYREYTTEELKAAYDRLEGAQQAPPPAPATPPQFDPRATAEALGALGRETAAASPRPSAPAPPAVPRDPREMPGQRLNTKGDDEPIRVDENGLVWLQEEVRKPEVPKPRGRRVLTYIDTGSKQVTAKAGEYTETFEVAGDQPGRPAEVKITLPSYQVGIYRDPRLPFKVHVYNDVRGFDFFEVNDYYGGSELVPSEVKRMYVANTLCYDIRTVVRAIQTEYRNLQLQGKVQ